MSLPVLIMTRPALDSRRFVAGIKPDLRAKLSILISPLLQIVPTGADLDMARHRGVIFTSANGVAYAPPGDGRPAYCVGERTAQVARAHGWSAVASGQNAEELIKEVIKTKPPGPLIHISGVHQRGDVAARLSEAGIQTEAIAVYDQQLLPLSPDAQQALSSGLPCIIPVFSPRTAAHLASFCTKADSLIIVALSDAVAQPLADCGAGKLIVADEPSSACVYDALETALDWATLS
ncbi:uroporphyrinogen-III synthase [Sulfitobacter marinus]|uniref:Uroporphyrinogen-III synthase n=1 Tax=Sulfitobacter marinus TaxID=394264 RepID=A0A1I6T3N6_9RHOB|nr:uroporphyrinogen-III synthase [Sulfitobacter marinus]SFS83648.1 uroporphyrinogen-III synthase [Sulfitobacter marinus]